MWAGFRLPRRLCGPSGGGAMRLTLVKVDSEREESAFWVWVDGKQIGAITAQDAELMRDYIDIAQGAFEDSPTRLEKHEQDGTSDTPEEGF